MSGNYTTAAALRQAIDDRIRAEARATGRDPNWLRRRVVFCRALARLFKAAPQKWILKGGLAVEVRRPGLARATRDVDLILCPGLVSDPSDGDEVREALADALAEDPDGDRLEFRVGRVSRLKDDAYGRPAWRFSVASELAGRRMADISFDIVARPEEIGGVETRTLPDVLGFTGISAPEVTVVDLQQQYAEKIHALTRIYAGGTSSRPKDLVDLVLLIQDGVEADTELVARVRHVFAVRRAHDIPTELPEPPEEWAGPFSRLAGEVGLEPLSVREANEIVAAHWRRAREYRSK